jgi:hypothetical protein
MGREMDAMGGAAGAVNMSHMTDSLAGVAPALWTSTRPTRSTTELG